MKSYREFCSTAKALDVVGDRWALLVVRELLLGPRRYTDLLEGLPGIGTNVLSTRLRELEEAGVVDRRTLPAPSAATVYELTDDGRELRDVVNALARWGAQRLTRPAPGDAVKPRWFVLSLASTIEAQGPLDDGTFELCIDDERFTLDIENGSVIASHGPPTDRTATLSGALPDFFGASRGQTKLARRIRIDGDRQAAQRLIDAMKASTPPNAKHQAGSPTAM